MADNTSIKDAAGATVLIATDDVAGVQVQRQKSAWGVDGAVVDTSASNPLPVTIISSSVGSTVDVEDGTIAGGQSNVTAVASLPYSYDPTAGNWTRVAASSWNSLDLDETEEDIKTTAGTLYGYHFLNLHATAFRYISFYNATAATVVVGTTPILFLVMCPPVASGHIWFGAQGPAFTTALSAAATTSFSGAGAPGTNEVILTAWYK